MALRIPGNIHYGPAETQQQYENVLINGCFRLWQRGETITAATAFPNTDDNYCADRWCFLTELNDVADLSREETTVPDGFNSAFQFTVQAAVGIPSERFGILQVIENQNCAHLIGENVNLSFYARADAGTEVRNLRAAVISWDGAADTVTSDVVTNWQAEGTDPTLAANWTYENVPADLLLTAAYQRFTIANVAIDTANTTNVGVFIWVDDDDLLDTELFYVAGVQIERTYEGRGVSDFVHRPIQEEIRLAHRYFNSTFQPGVTPQQDIGNSLGALTDMGADSTGGNSGTFSMKWRFGQPMFAVPTAVAYNPGDTTTQAWNVDDASDTNSTIKIVGEHGLGIETDGIAAGNAMDTMAIHATAEAEL